MPMNYLGLGRFLRDSTTLIPFCQILDTNKSLSRLLCKDLNQKKSETLFLIWYQPAKIS
jgi:hypothetical protein